MCRSFHGALLCLALLMPAAPTCVAATRQPVLRKELLEVKTPEGVFRFKKLMVQLEGSTIAISGTITNDTEREWRQAAFKIALFDEAGHQLQVRPSGPTLRYASSRGRYHASRESAIDVVIHDLPVGQTRYFHQEEIRIQRRVLPSNLAIATDDSSQTEYRFALVDPETVFPWDYEDDIAEFVFSPSHDRIGFTIENKTNDPLKIDWEKSAYIDPDGVSHRIIHRGVKLVERAQAEEPTTIPPLTQVDEFAYPADEVAWVEDLREWKEPELFPASGSEGRTFSLSLTVMSGADRKDYVFRFQIE